MAKITKKVVDVLSPDSKKDVFIWDSEIRGFGVRMKRSGTATYLIQYRTPEGGTRRFAIGKVGTLTPDEARKLGREKLAEVAHGKDPSSDRHKARETWTVAELCDEYLKAAKAGLVTTRFGIPKKSSTLAIDDGRISRHIKPILGQVPVTSLKRSDVQRLADAITTGKTAGVFKGKSHGKAVVTGGSGSAARVIALLGGIWTWATKRGLVTGHNPAHGIETRAAGSKERFLDPTELTALGKSMKDAEPLHARAAAAIRLLAFTGMRRQEACGLKWDEVDFEARCLRLQATKTGRSSRPLAGAAVALLEVLRQKTGDTALVFPNVTGSGPACLKKHIAAIFDNAGLADARSHDLRRTFASVAADEGYGDATIAELLGHARRGVTARHYIRRPDAALIAAADCVAEKIRSALDARDKQSSAAANDDNPSSAPTPEQSRGHVARRTVIHP